MQNVANKENTTLDTSTTKYPTNNLVKTNLDLKQDTLVSGTSIKTIEGQSILGSGNIDLNKSDVGLSNVDNTSDLNKPISTATQTALDNKADLVGGLVPQAQSQGSTLTMDYSTYRIEFTDARGEIQIIDLPIESLFKDANYDSYTKKLSLILDNGTGLEISLEDLVDLPEIQMEATNPSV